MRKVKVDLGCGWDERPNGWVMIDIDRKFQPDIVANVEQGIPLADGCADEVYMGHFLEHIRDVDAVTSEVNRIAAPGAIIRILVPDVQHQMYHMPTHCQPWSRYWFENCMKLWELVSVEEVSDPEVLAVARRNFHWVSDEDAMLLFWNCRKELRVVCRKRDA
mgnify:CR=1 FL=1